MSDVTQILSQIESGDPKAAEQLLPLVYAELRVLASRRMDRESRRHTLQPTALVHEAYLRLVDVEKAQGWQSRGHFFAAAAEAMRRILVENARRKSSLKRGGDWQRVSLEQADVELPQAAERFLALNEALAKLTSEHPDHAEIVKLRYFAGLTIDEAAKAVGISNATANRHWSFARAWLQAELTPGKHAGPS